MTRPDSTDHHRKWAAAVTRLTGSADEPAPPAAAPAPPARQREASPPRQAAAPPRQEASPPTAAPAPPPRQPAARGQGEPSSLLGWLSGLLGKGGKSAAPKPVARARSRSRSNSMGAKARAPETAPALRDREQVDSEIRREVLAYREDGHVVANEADLCRILANRFWRDADGEEQSRLCDEALNGLAREGAIQRFAVGEVSMCYLKFR